MQERVNLQAKELQEAQTLRKQAVQEVTDVNDKVNELRSKNVKLSNELLARDDLIEELQSFKRPLCLFKFLEHVRSNASTATKVDSVIVQVTCFQPTCFNDLMALMIRTDRQDQLRLQ